MEKIKKTREWVQEKGLGILLTLIGFLLVALGGWIIYTPLMNNVELLGVGAVILGLYLLLPGGLLLT